MLDDTTECKNLLLLSFAEWDLILLCTILNQEVSKLTDPWTWRNNWKAVGASSIEVVWQLFTSIHTAWLHFAWSNIAATCHPTQMIHQSNQLIQHGFMWISSSSYMWDKGSSSSHHLLISNPVNMESWSLYLSFPSNMPSNWNVWYEMSEYWASTTTTYSEVPHEDLYTLDNTSNQLAHTVAPCKTPWDKHQYP